jgi:hypothetical protein
MQENRSHDQRAVEYGGRHDESRVHWPSPFVKICFPARFSLRLIALPQIRRLFHGGPSSARIGA